MADKWLLQDGSGSWLLQDGSGYWILQSNADADVFFENRHPIAFGMKPITAAGMGGVLIE